MPVWVWRGGQWFICFSICAVVYPALASLLTSCATIFSNCRNPVITSALHVHAGSSRTCMPVWQHCCQQFQTVSFLPQDYQSMHVPL